MVHADGGIVPCVRRAAPFLILALSLTANPSVAQPAPGDNRFCRSVEEFNRHLAAYNEARIWSGSSGTSRYEIYSAREQWRAKKVTRANATWTVAYVLPDGRKCLVATGIRWEDSIDARVQTVPMTNEPEDMWSQDPESPRPREDSDFVIMNTRLKMVDACNNGYSLAEVVAKSPYVLGEGTVEEASDHVHEYAMSAHHPDHLFLLSSAPNGPRTMSASWAILYPLPVVDRDLTLWGCTYIEAVGTHGRKQRPMLGAKNRH